MPTYVYKCTSNHVFEEQRSIKDVEVLPKICVDCGKIMKRLYFEPSIALKGKGFYRNGG